ncbi:hypothetical protein HPB47_007180 [Ixodes persulcatus]|uniref:Uncharacterized protein n=1 Tax=Ixodes persulcatus TaxID=34615 RepID=A0AC60P8B5_IXOPE|nr:hypothetical protein HPB47_007180 [Ixodes persulcatus]
MSPHRVSLSSLFCCSGVSYASLIAVSTCRARHYSYAIRTVSYPPDVLALFVGVLPSAGHAKRICKILRSEIWKQVDRYRDCLRIWCSQSSPTARTDKKVYGEHLRLASQTLGFMWEELLVSLPRKTKASASVTNEVLFLRGAQAPKKITEILELGPKFSIQPTPKPIEELCLARTPAEKVIPEERERCISEAVDVIRRNPNNRRETIMIRDVVTYFRKNQLKLLTADKEGAFSHIAIIKDFRQVNKISLSKVKPSARVLCDRLQLSQLAKKIQASKKLIPTAWSQRRNSPNHFPLPSGPGDPVACTVHVFRNRRAPKAGASRAGLRCDDDRF